MNKQTLWLITELFPPEETSTAYIFGEIANALSDKYIVKVICGPEVYDKSKKKDFNNVFKLNSSIEVFHVEGIEENKNSVVSRVRKFLVMTVRLYRVAKHKIQSQDKVLIATNPFPLIIPIAKLKRKRGFCLEMLVHDIFPEPLTFRMNIPKFIYNVLYRMFGRAYSTCDLLFSLGRDMTEILKQKTSKYNSSLQIVQVENWGDIINIVPTIRPVNLPMHKIIIQYAGNIGEAQGVQQFVDRLAASKAESVLFSIWGTGAAEDKLKQRVQDLQMNESVKFNGPYFRSQQTNVLNECDIALVSLKNIIRGIGVPSKSYNILAAGKPILFIGPLDSEIALMVKENNIGYCFDEFDYKGIDSFLASLDVTMIPKLAEMGKRARKLVEDKYSKETILKKFRELV